MWGFLIVGVFVGLIVGFVYWIVGIFVMFYFVCVVLVIIVGLFVMGVFYEDGFVDVWDGIGGG